MEPICLKLILLLATAATALSAGVFELRLLAYHNEHGKDSLGFCCGQLVDADGRCTQPCSTFFRVCLKQYQNSIDPEPPCTYGSHVTEVIGGNSVDFGKKQEFEQPFKFPFSFAWPGTFSLIVEAWHNTTQRPETDPVKQLLFRLAEQKTLNVGSDWTLEVHGSNGSRLELQYRVVCSDNHYGPDCNDYCRKRDDSHGHYTCATDGSKVCLAGWQGAYCNQAICKPGCHPSHGSCEHPGECQCQLGYIGDFCNECQRYPGCQHGKCEEPFQCTCDEGWGGLFCNQDLNYCTHHKPCINGATCTNTGAGHYTCTCEPGFTGTNCEIKIEDCSLEPCLNGGTCKELVSNYSCACPEGISGRHCQISAKSCEETPCENGGTCVDRAEGGYMCLCQSGWEGTNCDGERDECQPNPCENGGRCVDSFNGFQCVCPVGFEGNRCEQDINDCSKDACLNGGTCLDEVNSFRCKCRPGWMGTLCQENIDDCVKRPCANGGTCFDLVNDYRCMCRPGFKGKDCSIDNNECESNPCRNGGSCEDLVDDYICHCPSNCFRGKNCEIRDDCKWDTTFRPQQFPNVTALPPVQPVVSGKLEHTLLVVTLAIFLPIVFVLVVIVLLLYRRNKRHSSPRDPEAQNARNQRLAASSEPAKIMNNNLYVSAAPNPYSELQKPKMDNRERYAALKVKNLEADANSPSAVSRLRESDDPNTFRPACKAISVEKLSLARPSKGFLSPQPRSSGEESPPFLRSEISTDSGLGSPTSHSLRHHRGSDLTLESGEDETVLIVEAQTGTERTAGRQVHRHPPPSRQQQELATQV